MEDWHADGSCSGTVCACVGMTCWRGGVGQCKERKHTHTHLGMRIVGIRGWCACVRRVGMQMWIHIKKEREKKYLPGCG